MNYTLTIFKIFRYSLTILTVSVVALIILGHFGYVDTVRPFVVQSGSMEPAIPTASIVFSLPQKTYQQGDIITFHPNGDKTKTVTHRVEFKLYPDGIENDALFMTAGDANEDVDRWEVRKEQIIGKAIITVPYVGYLVDFAKKPQGFILLVIVPATIVIYEELKNLIIEIVKGLKNMKMHHLQGASLKGSRTITNNKFTPPKSWIIIPIFCAGIFMITFSAGYFYDVEKSLVNIFRAGVWETPSPSVTPIPSVSPSPSVTPHPQIATYLVINEVLYNPNHDQTPGGQGGSNRGEFVEIYNPNDFGVNVENWILDADGINVLLPNVIVPIRGFLIISGAERSELELIYGVFGSNTNYYQTDTQGKIGNGFDNAGGHITLSDNNSQIIDTLSYANDTSIFYPAIPDSATGSSFERDPDGQDTGTATDFIVRISPRPGE